MDEQQAGNARRWQEIVTALQREISCLDGEQRRWIEQRLALVHALQRQLHQLFLAADGAAACARCGGACCELGHNHMTLVNLLGVLLSATVPEADFSRTCPFLGADGCRLAVEVRPFNCVTFICPELEEALTPAQQEQFYALERQLRDQYAVFDERYLGSGMVGLLIRSRRIGSAPLLARVDV